MKMRHPDPATRRMALHDFRVFRQAWSPAAAYHLTRLRYGKAHEPLASMFWLVAARIPATGAAPTVNFPGLKWPGLPATAGRIVRPDASRHL